MCDIIWNEATQEEIESPAQLRALAPDLIMGRGYKRIDDTCCLCQVDVKATLDRAGIAWTQPDGWGDIHISITP